MAKTLGSVLAFLTPKNIETAGWLVAVAGIAVFNRSTIGAVAAACLGVYGVLRLAPAGAKSPAPLRALAKIRNWPEYGAASVTAAIAASHGGAGAVTTVVGVACVGAGRFRSLL